MTGNVFHAVRRDRRYDQAFSIVTGIHVDQIYDFRTSVLNGKVSKGET